LILCFVFGCCCDTVAMSIGLLVDYVMHVLLRYYEEIGNRREKTINMLRTMGASILLGGTTTFLGIIPLMFSVSDVFATVFYTFLGIVVMGMGHGLILLPVLLSMFGPEETVSMGHHNNDDDDDHLQKKSIAPDISWDRCDEFPDRFEQEGWAFAPETDC
jgi:uncharacterized membrane protein YdfJ with MMPL/SSD domain